MVLVILVIPSFCSCTCGENGGNPATTAQTETSAPAAHIPPVTTPPETPSTTQATGITSTTPTAVSSTIVLPPTTPVMPVSTTGSTTAPTATAPTAAPPASTAKPPVTSYALPPAPTAVSTGTDTAPGPSLASLTPALKWSTVTEADNYALYIFKAPFSASDLVYNPQVTGTSATVPAGTLTAGVQYKWAVAAHGPGGWSYLSNFLFFTT